MTGQYLAGVSGRALLADGAATALAGFGGGSGTTTYAENIGVMAATKVYSTAAYWVAGVFATLLSFSPKFGELIATVPPGVLGGAATMLYGMIGILGVKIWVQNKVNFSNPVNLTTAAVALIVGMEVGGSAADLLGLYGLALLLNLTALMWAAGIALRFRSLQAGPLMQTPVFLIIFLAPVYVPYELLTGWVHAVAGVNPITAIVEGGRDFVSGSSPDGLLAYGAVLALLVVMGAWALRGLRKAEAAGG